MNNNSKERTLKVNLCFPPCLTDERSSLIIVIFSLEGAHKDFHLREIRLSAVILQEGYLCINAGDLASRRRKSIYSYGSYIYSPFNTCIIRDLG